MWIMTSFGILMPAIRPVDTIEEGDLRTMQVRTRRAQDLDILRAEFLPELGETIHTPEFDYNYRAYCTPQQLADATAKIILAIDYKKFKPTTDRYKDNDLHRVYNEMWGTVTRLGTPWEAAAKRRQEKFAEDKAAGKFDYLSRRPLFLGRGSSAAALSEQMDADDMDDEQDRREQDDAWWDARADEDAEWEAAHGAHKATKRANILFPLVSTKGGKNRRSRKGNKATAPAAGKTVAGA